MGGRGGRGLLTKAPSAAITPQLLDVFCAKLARGLLRADVLQGEKVSRCSEGPATATANTTTATTPTANTTTTTAQCKAATANTTTTTAHCDAATANTSTTTAEYYRHCYRQCYFQRYCYCYCYCPGLQLLQAAWGSRPRGGAAWGMPQAVRIILIIRLARITITMTTITMTTHYQNYCYNYYRKQKY